MRAHAPKRFSRKEYAEILLFLRYSGTKYLTAKITAMGIDRLNTKPFQLVWYALPGSARKLILLTKVAKMDMPTTQEGMVPPPEVNESDDRLRK